MRSVLVPQAINLRSIAATVNALSRVSVRLLAVSSNTPVN